MPKAERKMAKNLAGQDIMHVSSSSGFSDYHENDFQEVKSGEFDYMDDIIEKHDDPNKRRLI
jgi:hypothetical protein